MYQIGHQIYLRRLEKGLTQAELAVRTRIPQPNISNIEKGKQDVTISTLRRIGHALDMKLAEFFEEEGKGKMQIQGRLGRPVIERLARAVVRGKVPLSRDERQIVSLFLELIPRKHSRASRVRKTQAAWLKLRCSLTDSEIKILTERIREEQARAQ